MSNVDLRWDYDPEKRFTMICEGDVDCLINYYRLPNGYCVELCEGSNLLNEGGQYSKI